MLFEYQCDVVGCFCDLILKEPDDRPVLGVFRFGIVEGMQELMALLFAEIFYIL